MDIDVRKVILRFEQNNNVLNAGKGFYNYRIVKIDGLTALDFDFIQTESPQISGSNLNYKRALNREIDIVIDCSWDLRDSIIKFFNPYKSGKLYVTWNKHTRWIEYESYPPAIIQQNVWHDLTLKIRLLCMKPFFLDMDDYGRNIADKVPLLAFPFVMLERGVTTDYKTMSQKVTIQNNGDVETGCKVVFTSRGDVKNPRFTLNGISYFSALIDMVSGDELIFNTDVRNISVTLNKENILNKTDPKSTFFQIPVGENTIEYSAEEGASNLDAVIYYTPKYLGV